MTNIATNLIDALTATFRADAQDLLTTVKALASAFDTAELETELAISYAIEFIRHDLRDRLQYELDCIADDPNHPRDLVLQDVRACITEFFG